MKYPVITVTTSFPGKSSFISHKALRGSDYNPHFSGRESEAQSCQKKLVSKSDNSSEEEQNTNKLRDHGRRKTPQRPLAAACAMQLMSPIHLTALAT